MKKTYHLNRSVVQTKADLIDIIMKRNLAPSKTKATLTKMGKGQLEKIVSDAENTGTKDLREYMSPVSFFPTHNYFT